MTAYYSLDVIHGYEWLDHTDGPTEVSILHPDYRPGDRSWNRRHQAWPITQYVGSIFTLLRLVNQYAGERLLCYGINPRPDILRKPDGRLRSAKETDITMSQTLVLDVDLEGTVTPEREHNLATFLRTADDYFASLGIAPPVRASTGRGVHLLFAYPPITVADYPSLRDRLRTFKHNFSTAHRQDLSRLEARVDSTQDLRRMVRVYGTSKPGVGIISRFHGEERHPDPALREHLLHLPYTPTTPPPAQRSLTIADLLPDWFGQMLRRDAVLNDLWQGTGKLAGTDQSNSGYDYTIARYLAQHGITNHDTLATIIALRPTGAKERARKGVEYLLRTVTSALAGYNGHHPGD
jgi:hypothetical protein